ncbi:hypothetical protein NMG60_11034823 [Bertholletia excelsa]
MYDVSDFDGYGEDQDLTFISNPKERSSGRSSERCGSFGSPPSRGFNDISCRTFHSGEGILGTSLKTCTIPVIKRAFSLKPQSPSVSSRSSSTVANPINIKANANTKRSFSDEFPFYKLWAGPEYSNSPPPSSMPLPKFSLRTKRTVSLDLPASSAADINIHTMAKSSPSSPARDLNTSFRDIFHGADSATENLRRILNLDTTDE